MQHHSLGLHASLGWGAPSPPAQSRLSVDGQLHLSGIGFPALPADPSEVASSSQSPSMRSPRAQAGTEDERRGCGKAPSTKRSQCREQLLSLPPRKRAAGRGGPDRPREVKFGRVSCRKAGTRACRGRWGWPHRRGPGRQDGPRRPLRGERDVWVGSGKPGDTYVRGHGGTRLGAHPSSAQLRKGLTA